MPNLYVDVDDTLLLYCYGMCKHGGTHPYGDAAGQPWAPNEPLINGIRKFARDNPDAIITIWSGGGDWYAEQAARRLGLDDLNPRYLGKFFRQIDQVQVDDIVVDDMLIEVPCKVFLPDEWPPLVPDHECNDDCEEWRRYTDAILELNEYE